ncbi:hypothetical protein STAS_22571, partial [Striga asiatica]
IKKAESQAVKLTLSTSCPSVSDSSRVDRIISFPRSNFDHVTRVDSVGSKGHSANVTAWSMKLLRSLKVKESHVLSYGTIASKNQSSMAYYLTRRKIGLLTSREGEASVTGFRYFGREGSDKTSCNPRKEGSSLREPKGFSIGHNLVRYVCGLRVASTYRAGCAHHDEFWKQMNEDSPADTNGEAKAYASDGLPFLNSRY